MRYVGSAFGTLAICAIMVVSVQSKAGQPYMLLNPAGWAVPDLKELLLEKSAVMTFPGLPSEITAETWKLPADSSYLVPFRPIYPAGVRADGKLCEKPARLVIYRSCTNVILCYEYSGYLIKQDTKLILGVFLSYVCDLDGDGVLESNINVTYEEKDRKLLTSILRVKLGTSNETDLVRKIVGSALLQIGK